VEPTKSAMRLTVASHSGWTMTLAAGWRALSWARRVAVNCSWTMQKPGHRTMSRPVWRMTHRPRWRSGAKTILRSLGMLSTTRTALELVQMMSERAFTPAEQLM